MNFELLICSDGLPHLVNENPMTGDTVDIVLWDGAAWLADDTRIDYPTIDEFIEALDSPQPESWCEIALADFLSELTGGELVYGL